jgi:hypothetical protein
LKNDKTIIGYNFGEIHGFIDLKIYILENASLSSAL